MGPGLVHFGIHFGRSYKRFDLNKRTLMLSAAAAAALLTSQALAVGPTTISTVVTTAQKTSATGDLTIASGGGIKFTSATDPLLTIDSSNIVTLANGSTLTETNQSTATAILIDGTKNATGSLTENGAIDLSGTGTGKIALHLSGVGSFTGDIVFGPGTVKINGDQGTGIVMDSAFVLDGNLTLGSTTFALTPTAANGTSLSSITIASLLGTINGNVTVVPRAIYSAIGNGATGVTIGKGISGTFLNGGTISVAGVASKSTTIANAESGSALVIDGSIGGGIVNDGLTSASDALSVQAVISSNGVSSNSTIVIEAAATPITIGKDAADANTLGAASFINRGVIGAQAEDANQSLTRAILIGGATGAPVTFVGDFFNSGVISALATSTKTGSQVTATALEIDANVTIPQLHFSGQSHSISNNLGTIAATVAGTRNGLAQAIIIDPTTGPTSVPTITIDSGASVIAVATVVDPSSTLVTSLQAYGIADRSNSLTTINNQGTISATTTTLTNGFTSVARAVDVSTNTVGLNFTNNGTVVGDVLFGAGDDTYTISGTAGQLATHTGAIDFGGGGNDKLNVGAFSNVAGTITGNSLTLAVDIAGDGKLTVQNTQTTFFTTTFHVHGAPNPTHGGTVDVTVSDALAAAGVISASTSATFDTGSNLNVHYGSFLATGGSFVLVSAPTGFLSVDPADLVRFNTNVGGPTLPFLFNSASIQELINVGGKDLLELTVSTKSALQLGLQGYAAQMFPLANVALVSDNALGAAMIAGVNSQAQAQGAYDAFAPDVTGGARAVAISLTDQATGVVAARQRQLRLFAKEPGELTLWGNEFGEYLSTHGQTVRGLVDGAPGVISPTLPVGTVCPAGVCPTVALNGFKDHGFGFSLGLDSGAPDIGWFGAAFSFYTGDISEGGDRLSRTSANWYLLTGYTDWRGRGLFFDSQVTVGVGQLKGKRTIDLTIPASGAIAASEFIREADSKRAALVGALGFTTGVVMKLGSTYLTPQLAVDGMSMREEGFTEFNGGTGFDLKVNPSYANSLRAFLGTEIRQDLNLGDFALQPSARIGYRFDFINDPVKLHAAFADIDSTTTGNQHGAAFVIQGPDPGHGNLVGGININTTTESWTIGISYDFVRGSNNATEQVGTFSLLGRI